MQRPEAIVVGLNRIYVAGDLVTWVCGQAVLADDIQRGNQIFDAQLEKYGYVCVLSRIDELSSMGVEARRLHSDWHRLRAPAFSAAIVGGGLLARALVRLILTAAQLVTRKSRTRFDYFDSDAEALAWLDRERPRLRALVAAAASR